MEESFSIINKTKGKLFSLPFVNLKNEILGLKYNLSLVFVGEKTSRKLNKNYRGKDTSANILSFPLAKNEGEIFINLKKAEKDSVKFNLTGKQFVALLFIHGLLHLKGFEHSSRMEKQEEKILKKFKL